MSSTIRPRRSCSISRVTLSSVAGFVLVVSNVWTHPTTGVTHCSESRFSVRCRGELAENVLASVREGDRLIVSGTVVVREARLGAAAVPAQLMTFIADEVGMALSFHRIDPPTTDEEAD